MKPHVRRIAGPLCFLLIWTIILGVPRLRHLAVYQAASDDMVARMAPYLMPVAAIFVREVSPEKMAARYPDDVRVQVWAKRDYEELIARFPNEVWLYAGYLRGILTGFRSGRVAGTLDGTPVMPEKPPSLPREHIERALEVAKRGAHLEPRNGFYDLVRAELLLALRRDKEAVQAILKAAKKPEFNTHALTYRRKMLEVEEMIRPMVLEQQLMAWNSAPNNVGPWRDLARMGTWQALQMQQRGDWKNALELRAAISRIGGKMSRGQSSIIDALVGNAMQGIAWKAGAATPLNLRGAPGRVTAPFWAARFAALCRAHGRPDLAREATLEAQQTVAFQNALGTLAARSVWIPGLSNEAWMWLGGTNWMGLSLLLQLVITLPFWAMLCLILWIKRIPGEGKRTRAVLLVALLAQLPAFAIAAAGIYVATVIGFSAGNSGDQWASFLRWLVALSALLFSALLCGAITWWRHRHAWREIDNHAWAPVRPLLRTVITRLLWLLTLLSVPAVFFASSLGLSAPANYSRDAFWLDPLTFVFGTLLSPWFPTYMLLVCVAWWIASGVWLQSALARPLAGEALHWYRRALGASLLLVSVFYFVVLLYSVQVRRDAGAHFYALLQQGEATALRKAANVKP